MSRVTQTKGVILNRADHKKTVFGVPHGLAAIFGDKVVKFSVEHIRGPKWGMFLREDASRYETRRLDDGNDEFTFKNRGNRNGYFWFRSESEAVDCHKEINGLKSGAVA